MLRAAVLDFRSRFQRRFAGELPQNIRGPRIELLSLPHVMSLSCFLTVSTSPGVLAPPPQQVTLPACLRARNYLALPQSGACHKRMPIKCRHGVVQNIVRGTFPGNFAPCHDPIAARSSRR